MLYGGGCRGYGTAVGQRAEAAAGGVHGFPAALTSFIGRDEAVREVAGLLGESRLVTVTGPGGAGKTRLAGEAAKQVAVRFADGVWLAELAAVQDADQVAAVVALAVGVRPQPGVPAAEALAGVLARQQLLLVLDNCEHVIGAAAALSARLLLACDDVKILATSREPLRVAGEARYRLGPLTLPGPDDAAEGSEAVALFADRARRADGQFALDADSGPVVARLVDALRASPAWDPALSFVAESTPADGGPAQLTGYVLLTRNLLDAPRRLVDVLVLSPLAVRPGHQGRPGQVMAKPAPATGAADHE